MKKAVIILLLLFMPSLVQAQSMMELTNTAVDLESDELISNTDTEPRTNSNIEEKEKITVNINIDLPDIKFLPSNPLYFLKSAWEKAKGWFVFGATNKAKNGIDLANKRLEETETLIQQKKTNLVGETVSRFNQQMEEVNKNIEKAKNKGKDLNEIYNLLSQNTEKHQAVLTQLQAQVPDKIKNTVSDIKNISQKGFEMTKVKIKERIDILESEP